MIADHLDIENQGQIDSLKAGCGFNQAPGSPPLFVSQSFSCGLNGGSYGGRGGIGINSNSSDNEFCIKNSIPRMTVYGDPLSPLGSGATGSAFTSLDKMPEFISPGSILILTRSIKLTKGSFIRSGYPLSDRQTGFPSNSGGSIYILYKEMEISQDSDISSNGQSSDKMESGAGGGGRVFLHNYCWDEYEDIVKSPVYNFNNERVMAEAGKRPGLDSKFDQQFQNIIKAQAGSKIFY